MRICPAEQLPAKAAGAPGPMLASAVTMNLRPCFVALLLAAPLAAQESTDTLRLVRVH